MLLCVIKGRHSLCLLNRLTAHSLHSNWPHILRVTHPNTLVPDWFSPAPTHLQSQSYQWVRETEEQDGPCFLWSVVLLGSTSCPPPPPPHLHSSGTWLTHTLAAPYNDSPAFQVLSTLVAFFQLYSESFELGSQSPLREAESCKGIRGVYLESQSLFTEPNHLFTES